jgi:tRNA uridine 5-carbamoylmethylation protein Kti12
MDGIKMTKPVCTILVGLPALGKSTRVRDIGTMDPDVFVYSTDRFIEECAAQNGMTYNEMFTDLIDEATGQMNRMLDTAIRERMNIVWDQTNLGVKKRTKIIRRMKNAGYRVDCECFVAPEPGHLDDLKAWKHRLSSRPGKTIPESVLRSMYDSYIEPTLDEGFDSLVFWSMWGHLIDEVKSVQATV